MKIAFSKSVAAAAAAGLMGAACGGSTTPEPQTPEAGETEPAGPAASTPAEGGHEHAAGADKNCCKGMNDCKGKGGCHGDGHDCAGKNECKGQGGCHAHCPK